MTGPTTRGKKKEILEQLPSFKELTESDLAYLHSQGLDPCLIYDQIPPPKTPSRPKNLDTLILGMAQIPNNENLLPPGVGQEIPPPPNDDDIPVGNNQNNQNNGLPQGDNNQVPAAPRNNRNNVPPRQRTLRELAQPMMVIQPFCIQNPAANIDYEFKSGFIQMLPKFHGKSGDDPYKHLKEFNMVCYNCKPLGLTEEQVKLRAFPFSLTNNAKDWLFCLPSGSVTTWNQMQTLFLERYFPTTRVAAVRKEICGIQQQHGETLHEYWERFKQLCSSCPNHQISENLLMISFYEGLCLTDRFLIDAASCGAMVNKTVREAEELISSMAANTHQFGVRQNNPTRRVNEVSVGSNIEQSIAKLTSLVKQMAAGQTPQVKACVVCLSQEHATDACLSFQEEDNQTEEANVVEGYSNQGQWKWDAQNSRYIHRNPNLRWSNPNQNQQNGGVPNRQQQQSSTSGPQPQQPFKLLTKQPTTADTGSFEDMVKSFITTSITNHNDNVAFQKETRASIKNLETQVSQLATSVNALQGQGSGKLSSQPIKNPREQVSTITLRRGKEVTIPPRTSASDADVTNHTLTQTVDAQPIMADKPRVALPPSPSIDIPTSHMPYPLRFSKAKRVEQDKSLLDLFKRVEITIPLLEEIRQVPKYAKFLKDLCTSKRKTREGEHVRLARSVSSLYTQTVPIKLKDQGMFTIPLTCGTHRLTAMIDTGASINIMPLSTFDALGLGPLKDTRVIIELADKSTTAPIGVLEDVIVRVNDLVFPVDFHILHMEMDHFQSPAPILLGRPFVMISRMIINAYDGTVSVGVNGHVVTFDLIGAVRYPTGHHSDAFPCTYEAAELCSIEMVQPSEHDTLDELLDSTSDPDVESISPPSDSDVTNTSESDVHLNNISLASSSVPCTALPVFQLPLKSAKLVPSIEAPPELELKLLPDNLRYSYLGPNQTLSVIISNDLSPDQEGRLVSMLKKYKTALG
ncbi:hypothetical protein Dimus_039018 [Dionaea muscipula]